MSSLIRAQSYDPHQRLIVPLDITDLLPDNHLARFLVDVTANLDLSLLEEKYHSVKGEIPYHPQMMVTLLLYPYCKGCYSSRRIEEKTYTDIAYRYIAAGKHPDHSTISRFRANNLELLKDLFFQSIMMCKKAGLVKLGNAAIDGTKIKANASIRKTKNYKAIKKEYDELKKAVDELMKKGQEKDREEDRKYGKDKRGDELPENLAKKEMRLKELGQIKDQMEREVKAIAKEHNQKIKEREEEEKRTGKKKRGRKPKKKEETPGEKVRHNFTDPDSRMMKDNGTNSFVQGYNCQNVVDLNSQVVISCDVTQDANDKHQAIPMIMMLIETFEITDLKELQDVILTLDAGYYTEGDLKEILEMGFDLYISPDGYKSKGKIELPKMKGRIPKSMSLKDRMRRKIRTKVGKKRYGKRNIVEAPFGWIKEARNFRRFMMRGIEKAKGEWCLVNLTHNILVMHRAEVVL